MRAFQPYALSIGLRYDIFSWLTLYLDYKNYYRRFDLLPGLYSYAKDKRYPPGEEPYQYGLVKFISYRIGIYEIQDHDKWFDRDLRTESLQLGVELSHPLTRDKRWRMHYFVSQNRDRYEVILTYYDAMHYYESDLRFWYPQTKKHVDINVYGELILRGFDPEKMYQRSINTGVALSRNWKNGYGLRFELGFRNIYVFYQGFNRYYLLWENHWEIALRYTETDPETGELLYQRGQTLHFPLYIGGSYVNISLTSRPFRSKRDNPNYQHPCMRLRKQILRTIHKGFHHIRSKIHPS